LLSGSPARREDVIIYAVIDDALSPVRYLTEGTPGLDDVANVAASLATACSRRAG
jgi:hypothetical protein